MSPQEIVGRRVLFKLEAHYRDTSGGRFRIDPRWSENLGGLAERFGAERVLNLAISRLVVPEPAPVRLSPNLPPFLVPTPAAVELALRGLGDWLQLIEDRKG